MIDRGGARQDRDSRRRIRPAGSGGERRNFLDHHQIAEPAPARRLEAAVFAGLPEIRSAAERLLEAWEGGRKDDTSHCRDAQEEGMRPET
jgi:hypothetical protein